MGPSTWPGQSRSIRSVHQPTKTMLVRRGSQPQRRDEVDVEEGASWLACGDADGGADSGSVLGSKEGAWIGVVHRRPKSVGSGVLYYSRPGTKPLEESSGCCDGLGSSPHLGCFQATGNGSEGHIVKPCTRVRPPLLPNRAGLGARDAS